MYIPEEKDMRLWFVEHVVNPALNININININIMLWFMEHVVNPALNIKINNALNFVNSINTYLSAKIQFKLKIKSFMLKIFYNSLRNFKVT